MTQRERALTLMRVAGYHGDQRARVMLLVERRVNRQAMNNAWAAGVVARENGVRCDCRDCNP